MRRLMIAALLAAVAAAPAWAAKITETDLMQAAVDLGSRYDSNYDAKNAAGMAALYAPDGVLISPGPVVRGRANLEAYYKSRFASGATGHRIKILEVHVQGDGGYGIGQFTVMAPAPGGGTRQMHGNLTMIYHRGPDGWHYRLVAASVPPPKN